MKKTRDAYKLNHKNVVISAILVGLVFVILTVFYIQIIKKSADSTTYSYLSEISNMAKNELAAKIEGNLQSLRIMATVYITLESENKQDKSIKFKKLLENELSSSGFDSIFLVEPNGKTYEKDVNVAAISEQEYFDKSLKGLECIYVTENDALTGTANIVYSVPVFVDGVSKGMVCGTQGYAKYQEMLNNGFFDSEGYINIVDQDGNIVIKASNKNYNNEIGNIFDFSTFKTEEDKQVLLNGLKTGESGISEYKVDGVSKMAAYKAIGYNDWSLMSVVPTSVAKAQNMQTIFFTLVCCAGVLIIIIGFFLFSSFRQIRNNKVIEAFAFEDSLTGGINFNLFKNLSNKKIEKSGNKKLATCRIDIKGFKFINDMYGFEEGDKILKNMHKAIKSTLTEDDIFARIQNDEFIALLEYNKISDLESIDRKFKVCFYDLNSADNEQYNINFVVGAYLLTSGDRDVVTVIEKAAMAHRKAKLHHAENITFYDEDIREDAIREKSIENVMHEALQNEEFSVYYQSKHDLATGEIVGAEALVRWVKFPDVVIPPNSFIPLFEKNGFILNLDLYVLEKTCMYIKRWLDMGLKPITISVNQSKLLVYQKDYIEKLNLTLSKYSIPAELIEIELTETIFHENVEKLSNILRELKKCGFRISIDDFGSGYSSLNMLKDIEADVLKIDREFLCMAENTKRGETVLSNIIKMARDLNMAVVAEGVETEKQANLLRALNCHTVQGYLYAKPVCSEEFEKKLKGKIK